MKLITFFLLLFFLRTSYAQEPSLPDLIESVISGTVLIQTETSSGSGVIISLNGYILTNYHVVSDAIYYNSSIYVRTHNKKKYYAEVLDYDDDLDICLIKTSELGYEYEFPIVNPDSIKIGESVICIGNPLGFSDYVTNGIISKYNTPYVFTTAPINPGNSGGGLINMKGELVGIPTMTLKNSQNLNLAICPRTIRYFLDKNNIEYGNSK